MLRAVAAVAILALIAGCSTLSADSDPKVNIAHDRAACDAYGFKVGTDAYAQCMQLEDSQRMARDDAARERISESLSQLGANLSRVPPSPTTCTTTGSATGGYGNTIYGNSTTTCF